MRSQRRFKCNSLVSGSESLNVTVQRLTLESFSVAFQLDVLVSLLLFRLFRSLFPLETFIRSVGFIPSRVDQRVENLRG